MKGEIKYKCFKILLFFMMFLYLYDIAGSQTAKENFERKIVVEIPFYSSSNSNDTLFKIMISPENYRDYFLIDPNNINILSGEFPQLLAIKNDKFYLSNNFQGLRVYNINGECTYSFNYRKKYFVDYQKSKVDSRGNLYLVMKNPKGASKVFGYKVNNILEDQLSSSEIEDLPLHQNLMTLNDYRDINLNKNPNFTLKPEKGDYSLLKDSVGRLLFPTYLNIYENEDKISEINFSAYSEKIILTLLYYMDMDQNVFVIGVKSNDFERVKRKVVGDVVFNDKNIKILNPIFFIWKFETNK